MGVLNHKTVATVAAEEHCAIAQSSKLLTKSRLMKRLRNGDVKSSASTPPDPAEPATKRLRKEDIFRFLDLPAG